MSTQAPLPDGHYDVFVLDAQEADENVISLDVTVVTGEHKGSVVTVATEGLAERFIDVVGVPATLTIDGGEPSLRFD